MTWNQYRRFKDSNTEPVKAVLNDSPMAICPDCHGTRKAYTGRYAQKPNAHSCKRCLGLGKVKRYGE